MRKLLEVGCSKTSDRVPPLPGRELARPATRVRPRPNVVERSRASGRVQERVDEPERFLALRDEVVVEERDDGREYRRRRGGAVDGDPLASQLDLASYSLCCDVGVCTAGRVVLPVVRGAERGDVVVDRGGLVGGDAEDVRKAAGGEARCGLGHALGRADGGDEGAGGREGGDEIGAGVVQPQAGDATATGGEEEGDAEGGALVA